MESAESPYCVCNRKCILETPDCVPSSQTFKKFEMWPTKFPLTAARSNSNIFYNIMLQRPQKNMPLLSLTLSSALQPLQRAEPSVLQTPQRCSTPQSTSSSAKSQRNCHCSQLCQDTVSKTVMFLTAQSYPKKGASSSWGNFLLFYHL